MPSVFMGHDSKAAQVTEGSPAWERDVGLFRVLTFNHCCQMVYHSVPEEQIKQD